MKYFYANLAAHTVVFIVFVILTVVFLNRNNKRKVKHGFMFLAPVFFATISILYMVFLTGPRILDVRNMTEDMYQFTSGKIETIGYFNNTIQIEGKTFYINPLADIPEEGTSVRIKHTSYGNYVVEMAGYTLNSDSEEQ